MSPQNLESLDVVCSVLVRARPETIFTIFKDPVLFSKWLDAKATFEAKPGSHLEIEFDQPECRTVVQGEILEVEPDRRLVFSWGESEGPHDGSLPPGCSTVELTLEAQTGGTLVTLRHAGLPTEKDRIEHGAGWQHFLTQLSMQACARQLAQKSTASVDAHCAAWNEADFQKRLQMLNDSWDARGRFEDRFALVSGPRALCEHIEMARRMLRGATIERQGEVELCHANIRFDWRAVDEQGKVLYQGTDYGEVEIDGKIRKLVGFWDM